MSPAAVLAAGGVMAVITAAALVLAVVMVRKGGDENSAGVMLELIALRDKVKDLLAENERLMNAGVAMEQDSREKAAANAQVWELAAKLAGLLGYSDFEASVERLERMPSVFDEPSLYDMPISENGTDLTDVVKTNNLKLAYVAWKHWPQKAHDEIAKPMIAEHQRMAAQRMNTSTNMGAMVQDGLVDAKTAAGNGSGD